MKLFLLEVTLTLGTLDPKPGPTTMEEDSSLSSKLSECLKNWDLDPEELSDSSLGVDKNQVAIETEQPSILKDI